MGYGDPRLLPLLLAHFRAAMRQAALLHHLLPPWRAASPQARELQAKDHKPKPFFLETDCPGHCHSNGKPPHTATSNICTANHWTVPP